MKAVISLLYKYMYIIHTFHSSLESEHIHHTKGFKDNHSSTPSPLPPSLCSVEVVWLYFLFLTIPLFYYIPLTILAIDTLNLKFLTLTILDNCISNHWQIYFLPLTLTIVSPITNSCTIDNWHFYHLWLYFLSLRILSLMITLLKTDNSEQWQLHFLSSTIILLTTDNCTSYNYQL